MEQARSLPDEVTTHLRRLVHDLSNALETILQASYLLGNREMDATSKKWAQMIDTASHDAARVNREIREVLKKAGSRHEASGSGKS
jgi:light-regulated signal transduction histidine kinase (bacteriophytochrome)